MAEAVTLVKIFVFLGIVFVVAGLVIPGSDASWKDLENRLSGQGFPTFINPFDQNSVAYTRVPISNGTSDLPNSVSGCTIASYWSCVQFREDNKTFRVSATPNHKVTVNVSDLPNISQVITGIVVHVRCQTNGTRGAVFLFHETELATDTFVGSSYSIPCPNTYFSEVTYSFGALDPGNGNRWNWSTIRTAWQIGVSVDVAYGNSPVIIDYMEVQVFSQEVVTCTAASGAWFPWIDEQACAIGQFTQGVVKFFQFIVNGLSFILASGAAVMGLGLSIFTGITGTMVFLLTTLAIVPVIGPIFIVTIVGLILWFLYTFIKLILTAVGGLNPL